MEFRNAPHELRIMICTKDRDRLAKHVKDTGRTRSTIASIALAEYLDRIEEKARQDAITKRLLSRQAFVPVVEEEWMEKRKPRTGRRAISLPDDVETPEPLPKTIPAFGDKLAEDDDDE